MPPSCERPGAFVAPRPPKSFDDRNSGLKPAEFQAKSLIKPPEVPAARLRHLARAIHRLGERPLFELFRELSVGADSLERFEAYARLDPGILAYLGGDRLPLEEACQ
jgi:hypothetical protein